MSTSIHAAFNLFSVILNFGLVISNICGRKCDFLKVVKIPDPKKRFLVILRTIFSTYKTFPRRGWFFPVSTFREAEYFNKKKEFSSWSQKVIFHESSDFG